MASWDDVRRIAMGLPETDEGSSRGTVRWNVKDKGFLWERPLRRADYEAREGLPRESLSVGDGGGRGGGRTHHPYRGRLSLTREVPTRWMWSPSLWTDM